MGGNAETVTFSQCYFVTLWPRRLEDSGEFPFKVERSYPGATDCLRKRNNFVYLVFIVF